MKWLICLVWMLFCISVKGQTIVVPRSLQVTQNKTTNLIFPAAINSVDRGSERIIVQKSTNNILRVKADTVFRDTTNLSVITTDGKLYSFLVNYAPSPDVLNLDLGTGEVVNKDTSFVAAANTALGFKNNLYGLNFSEGRVRLAVVGVYSTSELVIVKIRLENNSTLSFETGRLQFHVTGSNEGKRRPLHETEVVPLLVHGTAVIVKERQSNVFVIVLSKVALAAKQQLQIDLQEKVGDRHLTIRLPNKYILNATLIK